MTAELGPGDSFGTNALIGGSTGSLLQAVESCSVLVLGSDVVSGIAASEPTVAAALDGGRSAGSAPQGGLRLTRVTQSLSSADVLAALQREPVTVPVPDSRL